MGRNSLPVYTYILKVSSNNIGTSYVAQNTTVPRKGRIKRARAVITTIHGGSANLFLRVGKANMATVAPATLDRILEYGTTANPIDGDDLDLYYELDADSAGSLTGLLYMATKVDAGAASVVSIALDIEVVT